MINNFWTKKNKTIALVASLGVILIGVIIYFSLKGKRNDQGNPEFAKYIESYTSGIISKTASIKIQLAGNVKTLHTNNEEVTNGVLNH